MNKTYLIKINSSEATVQTIEIRTGQAPAIVKIKGHVNVELVDESTGKAPQKIEARREGKNLRVIIADGDSDRSELILQNFYDEGDNHLIGMAENGQVFEYVPAGGENAFYIPNMAEGADGMQVLGGANLSSAMWTPLDPAASLAGLSPWALGALGALGLGAVAAIARNSGGGG